jgi:hypothetical protein
LLSFYGEFTLYYYFLPSIFTASFFIIVFLILSTRVVAQVKHIIFDRN